MPGVLRIGVGPCDISHIHVDMLAGMVIMKVLFKATMLLVFHMCSFHVVSRKYHLTAAFWSSAPSEMFSEP